MGTYKYSDFFPFEGFTWQIGEKVYIHQKETTGPGPCMYVSAKQ